MAGHSIRTPSKTTPTFWNRDALLMGAIGLAAAVGVMASGGLGIPFLATGGLATQAAAVTVAATTAVSAIVGAFWGRSRIQQENAKGQQVDSPTFFNKTMFTGLALGIAAAVALPELAAISGEIGGVSYATLAATGAGALSTLTGGLMGKSRMSKEYNKAAKGAEAAAEQAAMDVLRSRGVSRGLVRSAGMSTADQSMGTSHSTTTFADKFSNAPSFQEALANQPSAFSLDKS